MIPKSTLFKARILGLLALGVAAGYALSDPKVKESVEYGKYLGKHKLNIIKPMRQMNLGWGQALKHDLSKLGPKEFGPYREYFAGPTGVTGTNDPKTHELWRAAVRHHHNAPGNLHHYRALGLKGTVAPLKYKMEAVADWHSVQKTKGRTNESFPEWYTRLKDKLPIEEQTRMEIDKRLGLTKKAAYVLEKQAISLNRVKTVTLGAVAKAKQKYPKTTRVLGNAWQNYKETMARNAGYPAPSSEIDFALQGALAIKRHARKAGKVILKHVDKAGDKVYGKLQEFKIVK